ncbi:hypothetical protein ACJIZ3_006598 [Penstemon smallii]|uniref:Calponin-homology (CH) domain-containing protein n=1 Tax=Penstemon smallii TaxID=265156 RepID=A0ABD3S8N5_9LAMI
MESSRKPKKRILYSHPPSPLPNPQSIFKDISNFKTPKHPSKTPINFHCSPQFFTASKNSPISSSRRTVVKSKAARKLKAFELEQVKSARKAQNEKEKSLKSLSRSLTVWLNFLFESPSSCGCDPANFTGEIDGFDFSLVGKEVLVNNGKRESGSGRGVGVDGPWRGPKRQRDLLWSDDGGKSNRFLDSKFSKLRASLQDICSFEDLKERMRMYLSLGDSADIFEAMAQVTKNIDEGRLKMKASCPIVSDVGIKEKALKILMCYNPIWLRIGLYIILGGEFLLPNGDVNSEQESVFLRMVIENQFLCHTGLAKAYAYNKLVEGLYRPGYYEKLGNVILKRFLLLLIILDRAKSHTSLPLKYGIDGLDGGSPLLFSLKSNIKSSRQLVIDFLSSDVMHGEGNLLTHLAIVGYKITYQQNPLIEYDFKVTDLFEDLQDGVRLCRAIELLKHDSSILMKVVVPPDTPKKRLVNCETALQYLRQAGVPLVDEDGTEVIGEDVVNGDKELTLALLWNIFVHLQLPLLINRRLLAEEISSIRGDVVDNQSTQTLLDLLLGWIQAVCETYEFKIESHSSLMDGKAMWCLLDFYFRKEHDCSCSFKEGSDGRKGEVSIMSAIEYTDAVHNFLLSQKLTSLLGNFPEVLQVSDILEHNGACNGKTVLVLLVFLSVQLLVKRNMDKLNFHKLLGFTCQSPVSRRLSTKLNNDLETTRDFKTIMTWWQDMAQQNGNCNLKPSAFSVECFLTSRKSSNVQRENAATVIQAHFRRLVERQNYLRIIDAALVLQSAALACLLVKKKVPVKDLRTRTRSKQLETFQTNVTFMVDRNLLGKMKKSIIIIQKATRDWISKRYDKGGTLGYQVHNPDLVNAAIVIQSCIRGWTVRSVFIQRFTSKRRGLSRRDLINRVENASAIVIQSHVRGWMGRKIAFGVKQTFILGQHSAATKIQSHYRGWLMRKSFACHMQAIRMSRRDLIHRVESASAVVIQSHVRGWMARKKAYREKHIFISMQSYSRGWLQRKELLLKEDSARRIQSAFHCMNLHKAFLSQRHAAIYIQRFVRGEITRKRLLGASCYHKILEHSFYALELKIFMQSVVKLQRWWREVLQVKLKTKSAIVIQSHFRGLMARQMAKKEKMRVIVIQSYWKGYLARKDARDQVLDLRLRMQKTAANVDDSMRLINRLLEALSELPNMKSLSGILRTCATLDVATEHSQKCCEALVAAGAIGTLLKQIQSVSRSIPEQQVLKHALSTLRNLSRYPHLIETLVENHGCIEIIFLEFLRNKEEGYFYASELLKRICMSEKGVKVMCKSPAILRRLKKLVEELGRKKENDKRNARNMVKKEHGDRLKEAIKLLHDISGALGEN